MEFCSIPQLSFLALLFSCYLLMMLMTADLSHKHNVFSLSTLLSRPCRVSYLVDIFSNLQTVWRSNVSYLVFLTVNFSLGFVLRICSSLFTWWYYFWWLIKGTFRGPQKWWPITLASGSENSHIWIIWLLFLLVWQHLQTILWIHTNFCRLWINLNSYCSDKINALSHSEEYI